jgi:putative acetyltransferase
MTVVGPDETGFFSWREARADETEAVLRVHRQAFGQEDEAAVVAALMADPSARPWLSVVADRCGEIVGHALFTALHLEGASTTCSILAPLAVAPAHQRRGLGRGLIDWGCARLGERGVELVFVLGDPRIYGRFGFVPALPWGLRAPYDIEPAEAWQVRPLVDGVLGQARGTVRCADALAPEPFWRE